MAKMTPRTLSGFMELLPQPQQQMERMMDILSRTYSLYGFTPLDTPVIEASEVLLAKGGGETEKQIYRFQKGDADLALRAGVPMQPAGTTLQPASLIFMLGGVDTDALPMLRHSRQGVNYHDLAIREALEALREREEVPLFGGPWYCGVLTPGVVLVNMTRTQADMADNREATAAECLLHEHVHLFTELLRRHVPAFRNASLLATATHTGVRETRRIRGFHTLTGEEYLHAVDLPDAVSRGCHPVDIHAASSTGQRCEFLKEAAFIPYRCLIAPGFPNLLVAGRSFSADAVASASVRVQASVMGLGQAAGAAAAQCVRSGVGVAEIDVGQLRKTLVEYGANLTA